MATIADLINKGAQRLHEAGIADHRRTASLLLADILDCDHSFLLIHNGDEIAQWVADRYYSFIERRAQHEPLQYITGHQEFYGRDFIVTPAVLIPRPETELIIETTLKLVKENNQTDPRILDIGTGSGCVAVTLAAELPGAELFALDISTAALTVAYINAVQLGSRDRIKFFASDLCSALLDPFPQAQQFHFCCTNPPYVAATEREMLSPEVRDFEPALALYAHEDGTALISEIFNQCSRLILPGGYLLCEIGFGQLEKIRAYVDNNIWQIVEVVKDLQSIPRTIVLKKR